MIGANGWRPIETAPKDGKRIILYFPTLFDGRIEFGYWHTDQYLQNPKPYWAGDGETLFGVMTYRRNQPTHWKPVPVPPVK